MMARVVPDRSIRGLRPSFGSFLQPHRAAFDRAWPESTRAALLALLLPLAACVSDGSSASDGSSGPETASETASDGSGGATASTASTLATMGSEGAGDEDPGTTASEDTTAAPGDTTAAADDDSGSGGPACDPGTEPSGFTEVRGCPEPVGEPFCSEGADHVPDGTEIAWLSDPPHSGPHFPMWETWGEHEQSVARGNWVHNLEHGGIVLAYLCPGGCEAELDVLRDVIAARPDLRILMTADADLPGPRFAAISWTWIHRTDAPDLDTLLCFVDQHENHAPEDVP
jgi:hypothetical protein